MKTIIIFTLLCFTTICAEEVILKIATNAPDGSIWVKKLQEMDKEIRKKTKKRVQLKIYSGTKKGKEKDFSEKINNFEIDGALFLQSGMDDAVPQINLLKLPFFYDSKESWEKIQKKTKKQFEKAFENKKWRILGWTDMGFAYIFTSKKVTNFNEYQKLQSWLYEDDPLVKKCLEGLGVSGKELEVNDVKAALENKEIQSIYASPYLLVAMQWHENINQCIEYPVSNVIGGLVLHDSAFNSIPEKFRKDVEKIASKYMKMLNRNIETENEVAISILKNQYNVEFFHIDTGWEIKNKNLGEKIAKEHINLLYSDIELKFVQDEMKK